MRRRHRLLVAASLLAPACSTPTATRGRETSATPPAEAGPDVTAAATATNAGPAPTSPVDAASTPEWALPKYAGAGDDQLHRAALAVSVVDVESGLGLMPRGWAGDRVKAHFAFLAGLGYELSPYETAKLAEAKASGDA